MSSSDAVKRGSRAAIAASALLLASCALEEVTIPLGREVLVVQGVLTLDSTAPAQYIVVERSLTGTVDVPDQDSLRAPPRPPLPVSGASVIVRRDDGDSVDFVEDPATPGVYVLGLAAALPFLEAGRVYRLVVRVPDGRVVRGRMRMPGFPVVTGIPPDGATFNRDRDTLSVAWSGGGATKGVFVQVRPRDIGRRLTMFFFTDSTRFRLPGRQPMPFVADTLPPVVWVAGTRQTLSVAAVDTNLFDFTRSGNEPFTGSGFINTLDGALGVFGGVAPVNRTYEVVGDVNHPFEAMYRLEADAAGDSLTGVLRLYVTRDVPRPVLVAGLVDSPGGSLVPQAEAAGRVTGDTLHLVLLRDLPGHDVRQERWLLEGAFRPDSVSLGRVFDPGGLPVGFFRLERLP